MTSVIISMWFLASETKFGKNYEDHKLPSVATHDLEHAGHDSHSKLVTRELGQPIRNYFQVKSHDWRARDSRSVTRHDSWLRSRIATRHSWLAT